MDDIKEKKNSIRNDMIEMIKALSEKELQKDINRLKISFLNLQILWSPIYLCFT
ncbi:Uncharacterized protein dnl_53640 [Desulfonema limicola]|uniref:Uncharacterized protein n=1 Tax=Desulfonema limicola TaxID=45656 RepID=A0A975BD38_9BACT|nr:hypothetical protein [Desulfonema limicola]QTA82975.1 Uncharacterized protein dnl_53640 [Desulfonema limicola]